MKKLLTFLETNITKVVIVYFLLQIILVIFWQEPFKSDSQYYFKLAQQCISNHSFYPAKIHLYEDYITAPLYVNLLVVVLSIYNSQITIGLLNLILNALQLFFVYRISQKLIGEKYARISVLLYILYLNTLGMVLMNLTEFLFGTLVLSSVYFFLKNSRSSDLISGLLAAASIAVRPMGGALAASFLISIAFSKLENQLKIKRAAIIILSCGLFIFAYGKFTQSFFGKFVYTATSGPVNILIGANDNATGTYNTEVFAEGKMGYMPDAKQKTYIEKEAVWKREAEGWILSHPVKWISLFSAKFGFMFLVDDFAVTNILHIDDWYLTKVIKEIVQRHFSFFGNKPFYLVFLYFIVQILNYIYYFSLVIILIVGVWRKGIRVIFKEKFLPVTLFVILGLAMTAAAYGSARYRYPYMLFFFIAVAPFVSKLTEKKLQNYNL